MQEAGTAPAAASTPQRHPPRHGYHTSAQDLKSHLSACTPAETDPEGDATGFTLLRTHPQSVTAPTLAETRKHIGHQQEEGQDQGEEKHAGNGSAKQPLARPGLSPPRDLLRARPPREDERCPRTCRLPLHGRRQRQLMQKTTMQGSQW